MVTEPITLADGTHDQVLVPGVAPVAATARQIAQVQAQRITRRGAAPMPAGGLFDDVARSQVNLF